MHRARVPDSAVHVGQPPLFPEAAFDVVVIAASLGGREALGAVLGPLPADFPAPVVVVHHVSARSSSHLAPLLARETRLEVAIAGDGLPLRAGTVHLAPPGGHLLVMADGRCAISSGPPVSFARPAADLLFASAAAAFGPRVLGLVLTGRLRDGADGATTIRRAGGVVLAQDPDTCRAPDMPRAAARAGAIQIVLPPAVLAAALVGLVTVPGVQAMFGLLARAALRGGPDHSRAHRQEIRRSRAPSRR